MSITEIDQTEFDTILLGSSLTNCITFAALSRAGKRVLLLDSQGIHGYTNSTLTLHDYHNMVGNIQRAGNNPQYIDLLAEQEDDEPRYNNNKNRHNKNNNNDGGDTTENDQDDLIFADSTQAKSLYLLIKQAVKRCKRLRAYQAKQKADEEAAEAKRQLALANGEKLDENDPSTTKRCGYRQQQCPYLTNIDLFKSTNNNDKTGENDNNRKQYLVFSSSQLIQQNHTKTQPNNPEYTQTKLQLTPEQQSGIAGLEFDLYGTCNNNDDNNNNNSIFPLHNSFEYIPSSNKPLHVLIPELQHIAVTMQDPETSPEVLQQLSQKYDLSQLQQQQVQLQRMQQLLQRNAYRYNIDLIPHGIYSKSLTIKTLLYARVHEYMEFRAINRLLLLLSSSSINNKNDTKNIEYRPWEIPSSKNEIFVDPILSIKAKHRLTNLFLIILNDKSNAQTTQYHSELFTKYQHLTLYHLLYHLYINSKHQFATEDYNNNINNDKDNNSNIKLIDFTTVRKQVLQDKDLVVLSQLLLNGICQYLPSFLKYQTNNIDGSFELLLSLKLHEISTQLQQHLYSIGKYTKSPLLYPMYGAGELSQAWIRNGCVWGGVAVIRTDVSGLILPTKSKQQQDDNTKINTDPRSYILLSSGQVLSTNTLIMDRYLTPLFIQNNNNSPSIKLCYKYKDYTHLYDPAYIPQISNDKTNDVGDNNNNNNNNFDNILTSNTKPIVVTDNIGSNIITTQHIALVVNKLPRCLIAGFENNLENTSLQVFQLTQPIHTTNTSTTTQNDQPAEQQITSKYLAIDDTNGMSTNGDYMVLITTNLLSTFVDANNNNNNNITASLDEITKHIKQTTQYTETSHTTTQDTHYNVLSTLPQLAPFVHAMQSEQIEISYIGTYCQTNQIPILLAASNQQQQTTQEFKHGKVNNPYAVLTQPCIDDMCYENILITPDPNPSSTSPDNYIVQSQAQYYNVMEYMYRMEMLENNETHKQEKNNTEATTTTVTNTKTFAKYPILPYLMAKGDDIIIDGQTGEVLETLEHRNPHLAHVIGVIDQLESTLEQIENDDKTEKELNNNNDDNNKTDTVEESEDASVFVPEGLLKEDEGTNNVEETTPVTKPIQQEDTEADLLAGLDSLDLGELDGLGF